jgi:hypothetical protein
MIIKTMAWAVLLDNRIDTRTIGPTRRSAIVNWLYVNGVDVLNIHSGSELERWWENHCLLSPTMRVQEVTVEAVIADLEKAA